MKQKEIKIFGKTVKLTLRNEGDFAIASELFLDHQYRFCDDAIKKAAHAIVDIGGHLGFFSLYAALLNPNVPIFAFEPHEGNYDLLKKNLRDNRIKNVHPKRLAMSDNVGEIELHLSQEDLNHSTVGALEPTGEKQLIQSTTLERIFQKNRLERCDLVKIDCEGAEYEIIESTPQAVFDRIDHIFLEYHDYEGRHHQGLIDRLKKAGFKVQHSPNHKFKELGFLWCKKK